MHQDDFTASGSQHTFQIPVMGTGYTVDTPLYVAKYGISSVISLVDDILIEQIRKYHCQRVNEPYEPIGRDDPDPRANRIRAYLDLLDRLIKRQIEVIKTEPFDEGTDITRYFRLLPDCPDRNKWQAMLAETDQSKKEAMADELRTRIKPGRIDVNIMTRGFADVFSGGEHADPKSGDAMSGLRGFATSTVHAGMVFSAGLNRRLYSYMTDFEDFFLDENGQTRKKIIVKVSDLRSAIIQGRFMAKRGLWVHEYRVESGLNCGGHAFATQGQLLGPILEEFRKDRARLTDEIWPLAKKALEKAGRPVPAEAPPVLVTAQGGIGNHFEDEFLHKYYTVDITGWGSPFLVVPEITCVDQEHIDLLTNANPDDIQLSHSSPVGITFWNLMTSGSERAREKRSKSDNPGNPCVKRYARINTDFTDIAICEASRQYVRLKLDQIAKMDLTDVQRNDAIAQALSKSCICHDLAGGATRKYSIDPDATPSICPGPNILNFKRTYTLEEMLDHIYGRKNLLSTVNRQHMFITELKLYIEYIDEHVKRLEQNLIPVGVMPSDAPYLAKFKANLKDGINYYRGLSELAADSDFAEGLDQLEKELDGIKVPDPVKT